LACIPQCLFINGQASSGLSIFLPPRQFILS
jgi:hypothetical protein